VVIIMLLSREAGLGKLGKSLYFFTITFL
jgi:hypothetical protein